MGGRIGLALDSGKDRNLTQSYDKYPNDRHCIVKVAHRRHKNVRLHNVFGSTLTVSWSGNSHLNGVVSLRFFLKGTASPLPATVVQPKGQTLQIYNLAYIYRSRTKIHPI